MYEDNKVTGAPGSIEAAVSNHLAAFQELSARLASTIESLARAKDQYISVTGKVDQLEKERQVIVQEISGCAVEMERVLDGTQPSTLPSIPQVGYAPSRYGLGQKEATFTAPVRER